MKYISKHINPLEHEQMQNNSINQPPGKSFVLPADDIGGTVKRALRTYTAKIQA